MGEKPEINVEENTEPKTTTNYLNDVVGDMPAVSPAAEIIANKVLHEKQEQIPNPPKEKNKRGRPPGSKSGAAPKTQSTLGGVADAGQRHNALVDAERLATATFIAGAIEVSGVAIGGKAAAMGELEKMSMVQVWDKYLKSKNVNDIPPGMALVLIMGQYYGRVLTTPEAKPKVSGFFSKMGKKFKGWKDARFGGRYDRQRENDTSKTDDTSIPGEGDKSTGFRPFERSGMAS